MVAATPAAAAAMRKSFLVPEIKPLDQYDFPRARSAASLAWVLAKGYGGAGTAGAGEEGLERGDRLRGPDSLAEHWPLSRGGK